MFEAGTNTLETTNTAIEGFPACDLSVTSPVLLTYSGNDASNDTSCGFSAVGSSEGVPLELMSLLSLDDSRGHPPTLAGPLVDTADLSFCLAADQIGTGRPFDGDDSGTAECDIGAIELPEPAMGLMLASGTLGMIAMHRKQRRARRTRARR